MLGILKRKKREVRDRTVYMEIYGDNKVTYRVIVGRKYFFGEDVVTYGIEAEDKKSGECGAIPDFSRNIDDAVDFAEILIMGKIPPRHMYSRALGYLSVSI